MMSDYTNEEIEAAFNRWVWAQLAYDCNDGPGWTPEELCL